MYISPHGSLCSTAPKNRYPLTVEPVCSIKPWCSWKVNYGKQFNGQERKTFQKYIGSHKTAPHSKRWFQGPPERNSLLIQILKVEAIDRNRIGSDLNDTSTETGFFTVSPLIPKKASEIKDISFSVAVDEWLVTTKGVQNVDHQSKPVMF